jgi:predicted acetyltransferase
LGFRIFLAGKVPLTVEVPGRSVEFFIRRGCRGVGIGAIAATELFDRFRGTWKVAELERNVPAQRFWRRVIGEYTDGTFSEEWSDADPKGPIQVLNNLANE